MSTILLTLVAFSLAACNSSPEAADLENPAAVGEQVVAELPTELPVVAATMPPPIVNVATNTAVPATDTPVPTDTPEATSTPEATEVPPTATAVPVQPTNPPPPPPPPATATSEPAPPPPPAVGANGLIASHWEIQDRSTFQVGQPVWFGFTVANSTSSEVPFNALAAMPKKDGVDRPDWVQISWSGQNSSVGPGGMEWEDNIKLPEPGNYTLRLVICFDGLDPCTSGSGAWHTLSQESQMTIQR